MKPEFFEDYANPHAEPTEPHSADFDWDELEKRLGEHEEPAERQYADLSRALKEILDWILDIDLGKDNADKIIGRRVIALAWVIDPSRFGGASVRKLSARLGFTAPVLSSITAEVSRKFRISNKFQSHDSKHK